MLIKSYSSNPEYRWGGGYIYIPRNGISNYFSHYQEDVPIYSI